MKKLSRFLQNVFKSCTSAEFYQTLLKTPFSFSLKYFLLLTFLVSLVFSTQISLILIAGSNFLSQKGQEQLQKNFPPKVEFSLKNGQVTTNLSQPLFIPFSALTDQNDTSRDLSQNKRNLIVIDTKTPYSDENFQNYSALFWLTGTSLVYEEPQTKTISLMPLKNSPEFILNKQTAVSFLRDVLIPTLHKLLPFLVIGIYLFSFVVNLWGTFLYVVFLAFVAFLLTKVTKHNLSYTKSLQLTIHANTLPLLISTLLSLFFIHLPMPFWHSLLTLIILFYFLNKTPISTKK